MKHKPRQLRVSYQYQSSKYKERLVPYIRMSGLWLSQAGFETGDDLLVEVKSGALLVRRADQAVKQDLNQDLDQAGRKKTAV